MRSRFWTSRGPTVDTSCLLCGVLFYLAIRYISYEPQVCRKCWKVIFDIVEILSMFFFSALKTLLVSPGHLPGEEINDMFLDIQPAACGPHPSEFKFQTFLFKCHLLQSFPFGTYFLSQRFLEHRITVYPGWKMSWCWYACPRKDRERCPELRPRSSGKSWHSSPCFSTRKCVMTFAMTQYIEKQSNIRKTLIDKNHWSASLKHYGQPNTKNGFSQTGRRCLRKVRRCIPAFRPTTLGLSGSFPRSLAQVFAVM